MTANLVKPGDNDTSGSDLEIRLSPKQRPDRSRSAANFSTLASGGAVYPAGGKAPGAAAAAAAGDENTPTYWSASDLLDKHEQVTCRRKGRETKQQPSSLSNSAVPPYSTTRKL